MSRHLANGGTNQKLRYCVGFLNDLIERLMQRLPQKTNTTRIATRICEAEFTAFVCSATLAN